MTSRRRELLSAADAGFAGVGAPRLGPNSTTKKRSF
jgi:hypothetical protein